MPVLGENESESECCRGAPQCAEVCGLRTWDHFWAVGLVTGRPPSRCRGGAAAPRRSRPGIPVRRLGIASLGMPGATQRADSCGSCVGAHFGVARPVPAKPPLRSCGAGTRREALHNAQTAAHEITGIIFSRLPGWKAPTD